MATVSSPLNTAYQQCVAWVEQVLKPIGFLQYGPSTAAEYATSSGAGSLAAQGWTRVKSTAAQAGDILVFQPGTLGVDPSTGHIGVISGRTAGGGIDYTQANAPEGAGASIGSLSGQNLSTAGLSVWAPPAQLAADAAALAANAQAQLGGAGNVVALPSASSAGSPLSIVSGTTPLSLGDVTSDPGFLGSNVPGKLAQWAGQSSLKWSLVVDAASVGLLLLGVWLLFRQSPGDLASPVADAAKTAASPLKAFAPQKAKSVVFAKALSPKPSGLRAAPAPKALDPSPTARMHRANAAKFGFGAA